MVSTKNEGSKFLWEVGGWNNEERTHSETSTVLGMMNIQMNVAYTILKIHNFFLYKGMEDWIKEDFKGLFTLKKKMKALTGVEHIKKMSL